MTNDQQGPTPPNPPDLGKAAKDFWAAAKAKAKELGGKAAETAKDLGTKASEEAKHLRATSQPNKDPTSPVSGLKDKALDVWRRAPTLVVVSGLGLLLLCSSCCICSGFLSLRSGPARDRETPSAAHGSGTELTISQFRAQIVGRQFKHATFFAKYGKPDRTMDLGDYTYLLYACKDGNVRVQCPKGPFQYQDMIAPLAVDQD